MKLLNNLKSRGWPIQPDIFTVEEAAEKIHCLLTGKIIEGIIHESASQTKH
jgi:hypothetical protein